MIPGEVFSSSEVLVALADRKTVDVHVKQTGDRPIQVGSHFHFFEVNKALKFDREAAWGRRLAIASGTAVRFEPGLEYTVTLIDLGGERVVHGFNALVEGRLDDPAVKAEGMRRAKERGFWGESR